MDYSEVSRPDLKYTYEFEPHELDGLKSCCDDHGFAVAKGVVGAAHIEALKNSIRTVVDLHDDLAPGETRVKHAFVEFSPSLFDLIENPSWLAIQEHFLGTKELTIHRSAAILKNVGAPPLTWHTDWSGYHDGSPRSANDALNYGEKPSGNWLYLNGTRPHRAGLAVIEDSHRHDWSGPEGFEFTPNRQSFYRKGEEPNHYDKGDVPGIIPLFTEPGDMIMFAARTYHWAYPHNGDEPRLSCGLGFRAGRAPWPVPWDLPESARRFKEEAPESLQHYVEHYTGIVPDWKPAED